MNSTPCQSLDDYLAHDLTGETLVRFTAHLPACPECTQAVRDNQRLQALLAEAIRHEPVPPGLTQRLERRLQTARRRRLVAVAAALVAAAAVIAWFIGPGSRQGEHQQAQVGAGPVPRPPDVPAAIEPVRVSFRRGAGVVAVPEKMDSPNITFIWVYPGQRGFPKPAQAAIDPLPPERSDQ